MSSIKIGQSINGLTTVSHTRSRQTPRPAVTFKNVMLGGAQVLLSGAKVATQIVGGPILSAAVTGGLNASGGGDSTLGQGLDGATGSGVGGAGSGNSEVDALSAYQDKRLGDDLKLLALQEKLQSNNRQVTLVSNVMKTRHDTEKAAISNIRS